MVLITNNQASEVLQPGEQPFHFVTSAVSPQRTSVLYRGLFTVASMGRDHFNPGRRQLFVQRVAVIRLVSDQSFRELIYSFSVGSNMAEISATSFLGKRSLGQKCPSASIYATEPAPKTFQALQANTGRYWQIKLYNCGLSSESKELPFTYFLKLTCGSGYYKERDIERIREIRRSFILADPEKSKAFAGPIGEELLGYYLDEDLKMETVSTPVRPLSLLIDENGVKNIDLLKGDVEGSEAEVLRGIREEQWPIIRQVVVEVHDSKNSLPVVEEMLATHGCSVQAVPESLPNVDGKTMVHARRC
jgi:FkbM family methyltransferase